MRNPIGLLLWLWITGDRKQIVVSAVNKVRSYDFESGKVIWECAGLGSNTIPQPVRQDDLVFVMSGHMNPNLMAIRLGREGDLTGTDAVVWSQTKGNSYTPSPVIYDNKLYVLTDSGMISCYNARTGEPYYHQVRLPKDLQFQVVSRRGERQALPGERKRGCDCSPDGREV